MNVPVPSSRPCRAQGLLHSCIAISLALSPAIGVMRYKQISRATIAEEYRRCEAGILANIRAAARNRDMASLRRIDDTFSPVIGDATYREAIGSAIAKVRAGEIRDQLAVSRKLNLSRHRKQFSFTPDPADLALVTAERLSDLPR
jgi:hypothetical protein